VLGIIPSVASLDRSKFGYIAEDVTLIPPLTFSNPKNIFYGDKGMKNLKNFTESAMFISK